MKFGVKTSIFFFSFLVGIKIINLIIGSSKKTPPTSPRVQEADLILIHVVSTFLRTEIEVNCVELTHNSALILV